MLKVFKKMIAVSVIVLSSFAANAAPLFTFSIDNGESTTTNLDLRGHGIIRDVNTEYADLLDVGGYIIDVTGTTVNVTGFVEGFTLVPENLLSSLNFSFDNLFEDTGNLLGDGEVSITNSIETIMANFTFFASPLNALGGNGLAVFTVEGISTPPPTTPGVPSVPPVVSVSTPASLGFLSLGLLGIALRQKLSA